MCVCVLLYLRVCGLVCVCESEITSVRERVYVCLCVSSGACVHHHHHHAEPPRRPTTGVGWCVCESMSVHKRVCVHACVYVCLRVRGFATTATQNHLADRPPRSTMAYLGHDGQLGENVHHLAFTKALRSPVSKS
jgi:hypothetical protein